MASLFPAPVRESRPLRRSFPSSNLKPSNKRENAVKKNVKKITLSKETLKDLTLPKSAVQGGYPVTVYPICEETK
jgi:hypothetical protein